MPAPLWAEPAQMGTLGCIASLCEVGLLTWPLFLGTPVAAARSNVSLALSQHSPAVLKWGGSCRPT